MLTVSSIVSQNLKFSFNGKKIMAEVTIFMHIVKIYRRETN